VIDPKLIRSDPDRLRQAQLRRGADPALIDQLIQADEDRRNGIAAFEVLRAEQKKLGKQVAAATAADRPALLAETKALAERVKETEAGAKLADARFEELLLLLPNPVFDDVPQGGEEDGVVLEQIGTPRDFAAEGFAARDHLDLGERLGAIDMERGAKVSGARFYFLTGVGAELEFALTQFAMAKALAWGFRPILPPALVKPTAMAGTGFLGQASQDVYYLPADDLYLVGTSEVALAAYHAGEILDAASLPLSYVGYSPCFRRESGSYGQDTRGIFRVHWFDKVEMFVYCAPDDAPAQHARLLSYEKAFLEELEIPFQVIEVAAGDLGLSAARKYDCYAWTPSQNRYREVTSTSNCTEFQSRRLNTRARYEDGVGPVATLNGTLCAMTRIIVALLENHQQPDGSIRVPAALQPYLGGRAVLQA
jgi:seryl-tRNA synthetase